MSSTTDTTGTPKDTPPKTPPATPTEPPTFIIDFHTHASQNLAQKVADGEMSETDYQLSTLCILLELRIGESRIQVIPAVMSILPSREIADDLNRMCVDFREGFFNEEFRPKDEKPTMDVRWSAEKAPENVWCQRTFSLGNQSALLRYLKERGSIDTVVVQWKN